jgi:IrrE N-terminal-like domain
MLPDGISPLSDNDPSRLLWQRVDEHHRSIIVARLRSTPVPVGAIANDLNLEVVASVLDTNISGMIRIHPDDENRFQIKVNSIEASVRQRFTVAHEISHFLLHRELIDKKGITDTILFRSGLSDRKEAEANRLAAFMLLPWNTVHEWMSIHHGAPPSEGYIDQIAAAFKVSTLTVGYRFGF